MKMIGSYVAALPCGCSTGFVNVFEGYESDTAKDVATFIKNGQTVRYFTAAEEPQANEAWLFKCGRYPHEAWQWQCKLDPQEQATLWQEQG